MIRLKVKSPLYYAVITTLVLSLCSASTGPSVQTYYFDYENVLGTSFELKVTAPSESNAIEAEKVAVTEIDRLAKILSSYDSTSEFSRWQKTQNTDIPVSRELFEVLSLFDKWKLKTGGAISASAGIGIALWKKAAATQTLPLPNELAEAASAMKKIHWQLNEDNLTARHLSTDPLVLNSFVKSYILNMTQQKVMRVTGVKASVLNIGGDVMVAGNQNEMVSVSNPLADAENDKPLSVLNVGNKTIATSGNYRRGYQVEGNWYSHILDVRTAIPATEIISATVVANSATDAGALATSFNILSPDESTELARQIPGTEYLIITKNGERIVSDGWNKLELSSNPVIENKSDNNFELSIDVELARFEGRFHRPFVAVWVENKKKEPVRNLALWFNKPKWLPDLKKWYSKNYESNGGRERIGSISSATRSAGKYTLKWDGLDDTGKPVKSGKYTIYIEAAREHGTYQLIKQEIEWNGKPQQYNLQGGVEITATTLDYHSVVKE